MAQNNTTELELIKKAYPSICHNCEHARKPASNDNTRLGYVGCSLRAIKNRAFDWDQIVEAKEIAEGWVDLKSRLSLEKNSGIITNLQLLTIGVTKCLQFDQL